MRADMRIENMFDCRVINLARSPQRLKTFLERNAAAGLRIERFEAVDGSTLDIASAVSNGIIANGAKYTPGAIGNGMSHRAIWRESIARRKCALVFEDDGVLRRDISDVLPQVVSHLPEDWDILLLGYNTDSVLDLKFGGEINLYGRFNPQYPTPAGQAAFAVSDEPVGAYKLNAAFGICGYAISPGGAERLISRCFPMDNRVIQVPALGKGLILTTLDGMLNAFFRRVSAFACFAPLVLPINDRSSSSVVKACGTKSERSASIRSSEVGVD